MVVGAVQSVWKGAVARGGLRGGWGLFRTNPFAFSALPRCAGHTSTLLVLLKVLGLISPAFLGIVFNTVCTSPPSREPLLSLPQPKHAQEAGSKRVEEVHGTVRRHRCIRNGHPMDVVIDVDRPGPAPACHCGSSARPDCVLFGEGVRVDVCGAQGVLVYGFSGCPWALCARACVRRGAKVVPTLVSPLKPHCFQGFPPTHGTALRTS